jgi:hypothetical protein
MAVISISKSPEDIWCVAGWAFRQILDDVLSNNMGDIEMAITFEQSKTHGGLILYILQPAFATKIKRAIIQVASGILSGKIQSGIGDQPYGNAITIEQYRHALEDLVGILARDRAE